jgi:hypothetical protein
VDELAADDKVQKQGASHVNLKRAEELINSRLVPLMSEMNVDLTQIIHSVDDLSVPATSRM